MHLHAPRNFRSDFDALLVTTAGGHTASRPSSLILIGSLLAGSKAGLLDRQSSCWIESRLAGSTVFLLDQQPACWIDRRFIGSTAFLFAQIARLATVWIKIAAGKGHRSHPGSSPAARKLSAAGIEQWASSSGHREAGIELDPPPAQGQGSPALRQVWKDWGPAAEWAAAVQRKRLTAGGQGGRAAV